MVPQNGGRKKNAAKSSGNTTARLVDMSSQAPQMLLILGLKEDQGFDTMLETSHLRSLSRAALAEKGILDTAGCDPYWHDIWKKSFYKWKESTNSTGNGFLQIATCRDVRCWQSAEPHLPTGLSLDALLRPNLLLCSRAEKVVITRHHERHVVSVLGWHDHSHTLISFQGVFHAKDLLAVFFSLIYDLPAKHIPFLKDCNQVLFFFFKVMTI